MTKTNKIVAIATVVGGVLAAATSANAALNLPPQQCSYVFTNNLRRGMTHPDVKMLQTVLNFYPQTQVASTGAGSPGMETNYFGAATYAAAVKFQNLHPNDVLTPAGLTVGNGNVFALTRGILNQICKTTVVVPPTTTPTTTPGTSSVTATLGANLPYTVLVAGQASARLADFVFNGNGTVSQVKLMRTGVSTNNTLSNVYLYEGANRLAGPASILADGSINFNSAAGLFTVTGTRTLSVRADIAAGTSGQSVGVMMAGYNTGAGMVTTSLNGTQLPIASVALAGVNFTSASPNPSAANVNAGTMNYTVWSAPVSVNTRAVNLRGISLKVVGSIPADALANVRLYVDGIAVGNATSIAANGMVVFDLMNTPFAMNAGGHTLEVRGDIVKGSARNFQVSLDQASDMWVEDSQLPGVYVTATQGTNAVVNYVAGLQSVNNGTLVISNQSVGTTNVIGGASNVVIAKYKLSAYGEDMRVNSLSVTPVLTGTTPAAAGLNNVTLNVNGGAIASGVNWTSGAINFNNLGSNLVIPAGSSTMLEVRADMVTSGSVAYTAGQVTANLNAGTNNANGTNSNVYVSTAAQTASNLTISTANGTFAKTTGFVNQTISPNTANVKIGSFTLSAGTSEGLQVTSMKVNLSPAASLNNYTNLTVKDGSTVLGSPIGLPQASNNISVNTTVSAGTTKTFEVYADVQSAMAAVTADMEVTYRGVQSNVNNTILASGVVSTPATGAITSVAVNPSPVSQYVVGGGSASLLASYVIKSPTAPATITKLTFSNGGSQAIQSVTIDGKNAAFVSGTAVIDGLNIAVPGNNTGATVNVNATYSCYVGGVQGSGCNLNTAQAAAKITLTNVEYSSGNSIATFAPTSPTGDSVAMTVVASKPTVTGSNANLAGLVTGLNKVGEVTVSADAAGAISLSQIKWNIGGSLVPTAADVRDGSTVIAGSSCTAAGVCTFATPYTIAAGTSKTFSLYATVPTVTGYNTQAVSSSLDAAGFLWNDVIGGSVNNTATLLVNFPATSYQVHN